MSETSEDMICEFNKPCNDCVGICWITETSAGSDVDDIVAWPLFLIPAVALFSTTCGCRVLSDVDVVVASFPLFEEGGGGTSNWSWLLLACGGLGLVGRGPTNFDCLAVRFCSWVELVSVDADYVSFCSGLSIYYEIINTYYVDELIPLLPYSFHMPAMFWSEAWGTKCNER